MHPDPHSPVPPCACGCQTPRHTLIAHIREQLDAGTYATPGKLKLAARSGGLLKDVERAPGQAD